MSIDHEPMVCGGTGNHDGQGIDACDECELTCLEQSEECAGEVEYRWPGYGERNWPRCQFHGDARVEREEASLERNGNPDSPCPPAGFDPTACGERWDEDDY